MHPYVGLNKKKVLKNRLRFEIDALLMMISWNIHKIKIFSLHLSKNLKKKFNTFSIIFKKTKKINVFPKTEMMLILTLPLIEKCIVLKSFEKF